MEMKIQKRDNLFIDVTGCRDTEPGLVIKPRFEHYVSADMYERVGLKGYEPMTAKEIETEEQQDILLNDSNYGIEEKFDGTRALLHFLSPKKLKTKGLSRDESYLKQSLSRGSGFVQGKDRIYDFFVNNNSKSDRVNFLKDEFGTGGWSEDFSDSTRGFANHSPKGYEITVYDKAFSGQYDKSYTWSKVSEVISEMIESGEYYPNNGFTRCFSRRISEKTKWYCENTDSLPHLRKLNIPELNGTVLDGEMFIPNRPFKDVSSTLNCKWDKAIDRQLELGFIVFHAFDILFYKGIDLRKMPLKRRKVYLELAVNKINSPYVKVVDYQVCGNTINTTPYHETHGTPYTICRALEESGKAESYPNLYREYQEHYKVVSLFKPKADFIRLSPRAFYEYIVATGGEGVMLKPLDGKYFHKRGREYQKIKKYLTREVVIMGFTEPTDEYKGKFPTVEKWDYWETNEYDLIDLSECTKEERQQFKKNWYPEECRPVSKFYCHGWVGNIRFGVVITPEEMHKLPKNKKFNIEEMILEGDDVLVLEVGECSGFDEETRKMFSECPVSWVGKVVEVKANEIFKDTGKLRHPRFLRVREDKAPTQCTYKDHISG